MEAMKFIGSRTRGEGAEEAFDLGSNAISQFSERCHARLARKSQPPQRL